MKTRLHFLLLNIVIIVTPLFFFGQIQIGSDIDGEDGGHDELGQSVSFSSNGNIVAIGAQSADVNGVPTGKVRVYENLEGVWTQLGNDIDGEAQYDRFGYSVSLSADGNTVAIGALFNNGNGYGSGHVRIYEFVGGVWAQVGQDIEGELTNDNSGTSVSLSSDGSVVAIGAPQNDGNGSNSGHIRIYENIGGIWTQIGQDLDGEAAGDSLGYSVSLSADGSIVAMGAYYNDGNGNASGHVRIYENIAGTWSQLGQDIDGEAAGDWFGYGVSLSSDGSIVAIGAPENDGNGNASGHVRIYENIAGTWSQLGQDIDGEAAGDKFGYNVSLSADASTVAIGAPQNNGNGNSSGHVKVYENIGGVWTQLGPVIYGEAEYDLLGRAVSLSSDGSIIAMGTPNNDGNGNASGHVRVYENIGGVWTQIGTDIDGEDGGIDHLGQSVSFSSNGNILAIGAPFADVNGLTTGKVRIYENIGNVWTQIGEDIDGVAQYDSFGRSVSLSSDGSIVAIGAPNHDGPSIYSGYVRVFENIGGIWTQIGADIGGETVGDKFGYSISLSSDGSIVAIGAPLANGSGANKTGHVRIYKNIEGVWTQVGEDIDGDASYDWYGTSVSLSSDGGVVAIGAPYYSAGNGVFSNGHARIYENINGEWLQIGEDIYGEASVDLFGTSVSLSSEGSIVAIGAPSNDGNGNGSGHVRVYENIGGAWIQIGEDIEGEAEYDDSGKSVFLSSDGSVVAIGAPSNDGNGIGSGHVRIYENIGGAWIKIGEDIDGEAITDYSGIGISLSSDASIVAIGAPYNHGNGGSSGHVRVFDLSGVLSNPKTEFQNQITLFPNPTNNVLYIKSSGMIGSVKVYNLLGKQVYEKVSNSLVEEIDMTSFNSGMYLVKVFVGGQSSIYKIFKE